MINLMQISTLIKKFDTLVQVPLGQVTALRCSHYTVATVYITYYLFPVSKEVIEVGPVWGVDMHCRYLVAVSAATFR